MEKNISYFAPNPTIFVSNYLDSIITEHLLKCTIFTIENFPKVLNTILKMNIAHNTNRTCGNKRKTFKFF